MNKRQRLAKQYVRAFAQYLLCSRKTKHQSICQVSCDLTNFIDENPECTLTDLKHAFGTPKMLADSYMDLIDRKEIERAERNRLKKKILFIVVFLGLIMLVILLCIDLVNRPELTFTTAIYETESMPDKYREVISTGDTLDETSLPN